MLKKLSGVGAGVAVMALPYLTFAAAPTAFSTSTAKTVLDSGYDTFIDMITSVVPMLLPVIAVVGFIIFIWHFVKRLVHVR